MSDDNRFSYGPSIVNDFDDDSNFSHGLDLDLLCDSWVPESDLLQNAPPFSDSSSQVSSIDPASSDLPSSLVNYIENFLMEDVDWDDEEIQVSNDEIADYFSGVLFDDSERSSMDGFSEDVADVESDQSPSKKRRMDMSMEVNMALNQTLNIHMDKPCSAFIAKQESAVLFVESLLLGSLLWLVSLVGLFLTPGLLCLCRSSKALISQGKNLKNMLIVGKYLKHLLLKLRRRYRSMRARVKFFVSPVHAFYA